MIMDALMETVAGSVSLDNENAKAVTGELYHMPLYRLWGRTYNLLKDTHDEDSNENFPLGKTNKSFRLASIRR
jgi:hypothetical protein